MLLLAAQASRPISEREPDYTEETNLTARAGSPRRSPPRRRAELVHGSSLHVYGAGAGGRDRRRTPRTASRATSRTSRRSTPSSRSGMHARRGGFGLANCRLGIVYGPSPVEHDAPESQTVIDKFRRLAAAGEPLDARRRRAATIGAVHVADAARLLLDCPAPTGGRRVQPRRRDADRRRRRRAGRGPRAGAAAPTWTLAPQLEYEHGVAEYLGRRGMKILVTGVTGFLGWRAARRCSPSAGTTCSARPARRRAARTARA